MMPIAGLGEGDAHAGGHPRGVHDEGEADHGGDGYGREAHVVEGFPEHMEEVRNPHPADKGGEGGGNQDRGAGRGAPRREYR